ncbi:MAG: hypothetical protein KDA80_14280 [Planctomycetaceae bacterium]|nr:hypothetical protein [Planctomycetaceae bacterium]
MQASGSHSQLGRQQFLELLVTQLQYQDPLEPVGQQEFLQQLAQFSVVEGVEQLNLQFEDFLKLQTLADGANLIGREVEYQSPNTGETLRGRVEEARVVDGALTVVVEGSSIPFSNVTALLDGDSSNTSP